ncbi:MAG: response regulator [Solobacterium sp.]|nr:response regulator [Solobacterium sp.]
MKAICVDDEKLLLENVVSMCLELPEIDGATGFIRAKDALDWLETNHADIALLDIDLPGINGLELASIIKKKWPDTAIIFLTGYSQYAVEAFALRASGYLLKPVTKEQLAKDVAYALSGREKKLNGHIVVQTFGNFDIFVDGKPVYFKMARCKEMLAYLIDKRGTSVTRAEIFSVLWENRVYDRKMQKQLDVYIRSLRDTLQEYSIENIFELRKGTLRIYPEYLTCDVYLFFDGDRDAVNLYRGEYMSSYSWANLTQNLMTMQIRQKQR